MPTDPPVRPPSAEDHAQILVESLRREHLDKCYQAIQGAVCGDADKAGQWNLVLATTDALIAALRADPEAPKVEDVLKNLIERAYNEPDFHCLDAIEDIIGRKAYIEAANRRADPEARAREAFEAGGDSARSWSHDKPSKESIDRQFAAYRAAQAQEPR